MASGNDKIKERNSVIERIAMDKNLKERLDRLRHQVKETKAELAQDWDKLQSRTRLRFQQLLDRFDFQELEAMIADFRAEQAKVEPLPADAILRELPIRHQLEMSLDEALMNRKSTRDFSGEPIPESNLATILWACNGINRKDLKRTTPSALNWQDVSIYVVQPNGIWKYLPKRHALLFIEGKDQREHFGEIKTWMRLAGAHLVFVSDARKMKTMTTKLVNKAFDVDMLQGELAERARALNTGVKLQAAALATAGLGLAGVTRLPVKDEKARELLRLAPEEKIMAIYSVGYPSQSLFDHVF